jgi:c-di-GMP-binding flagellar brake protein YcgR
VPEKLWIDLPEPSTTTITLIVLSFVGLFGVAVFAELWRQRAGRRATIAAEWRSIRQIAAEKGLNERELGFLRKLIRRWAPEEPLRAATVRLQFENCVNAEMERLAGEGDAKVFEATGITLRDIRQQLALDFVPLGQQIHSTRDLLPGQIIEMASADDPKAPLVNFMVELVDEAYLRLRPRLEDDVKPPSWSVGQGVQCRMWREEDARYLYTLTLDRLTEQPDLWLFQHTADFERRQAREHFRIRHEESINVAVINAPKDGNYENIAQRQPSTHLRGRVTSLSAGGLAVLLNQDVSRQVVLRFDLALPSVEEIQIHGEIISTHAISGGRYFVRVQFIAHDEEQADHIAKYVTMKQQSIQPTDSEEAQ